MLTPAEPWHGRCSESGERIELNAHCKANKVLRSYRVNPHDLRKEHIMNSSQIAPRPSTAYELRFRSLFNEGRGYAFPCDAAGHVDMDTLSERARNNYLYARIGIGHEFSGPAVQLAAVA
jgi:hypothetical protein